MMIPEMKFAYLSWEAFAAGTTGILAVGAAVWVGLRQQAIMRQQVANEQLSLKLALFEHRFEFLYVLARYMRATRFRNGVSQTLEREFTAKLRKGLMLFPASAAEVVHEIAALGDEYFDLKEAKVSDDESVREAALARRKEIRERQSELFATFSTLADSLMRIEG